MFIVCIFLVLFTSALFSAWRLHCSVNKTSAGFDNLQKYIIQNVVFGAVIQACFGSLNVAVSYLCFNGIGDGVRCTLDAGITICVDISTLNLLMLASLQETVLGKTPLHHVPAIFCWVPGLFCALATMFTSVARLTPKAINVFCCMNWESETTTEKLFLWCVVLLGYILPCVVTMACFFKTRYAGHSTTWFPRVASNKITNIAMIRITLGSFYAICVTLKLSGYKHLITNEMDLLGIILLISAFSVTPYLLHKEVDKVQANQRK